jgi:SAM-dependent methyltransferase
VPEHLDRERLRTTFGSVAELYDRARPEYPEAVFDGLADLAALEPGARVLEIGPGTGKATAELVRRGYEVTGVELSPELAEIVRRNVPAAQIEVADFEKWDPAGRYFDVVTSFCAFHWIAPELRYAKPARLLVPGGRLAVVAVHHVMPADADPIWADVQKDYLAALGPDRAGSGPPPPESVEDLRAEMEASSLFPAIEVRRLRFDVTYTADGYRDLLSTFSDNIALPDGQREDLLRRIHARIEAHGGYATRHYLAVLSVGYRPR